MKLIKILSSITLTLTFTMSNTAICKGGGGNKNIETKTILKIAGGSGGKKIVNA